MSLVKYVGPFDEVEVVYAGESLGIVERNGTLDITNDAAYAGLLDQSVWVDASAQSGE